VNTPQVSTLRAAHELLARQWPGDNANPAAWMAYHQHAADLYDQVARTDPDHQHEARYWAQQQRSAAHPPTTDHRTVSTPCSTEST
jgi:hypothetical protein